MVASRTDEDPQGTESTASWAARVVNQIGDKPTRKLLRSMMKTVDAWDLIKPGDRIMVALSGGKDSYTLYDLLWQAKTRAPIDFEIIGVHLDQVQPGYEPTAFYKWLEDFGAPFEIVREDTYSVVQQKTKPGQAYCFICSRMRRGILYTVADRLGCNKIALGHHRDDAIETLLMNMFFAGKMQGMPASYTTDNGQFDIIRPLIETGEAEIEEYAGYRGYPILPCNLCGSQEGLKRDEMKQLMKDLEGKYPEIRAVMLNAMRNVRPSHLLDADVMTAWMSRDPELRPAKGMKQGDEAAPWRHKGQVVLSGGKLPILQ